MSISPYFSEQLQETISVLLNHNMETSSETDLVSWNKVRTDYHFSQSLTAEKYLTMFQFLKSKSTSDQIDDKHILCFLEHSIEAHLEKYKKKYMRKARWQIVYFGLSVMIWLLLPLRSPGDFAVIPASLNIPGAILWFGGTLLLWFNKIYFPKVKSAFKENALTTELCEYVYTELPKRKLIHRILYGVAAVMLVAACTMIKCFIH